MKPIDVIVLALIAIAFIAVCIRIWRKGTCADCVAGGVCTGHCGSNRRKSCAAMKGLDEVERDLSKGVR